MSRIKRIVNNYRVSIVLTLLIYPIYSTVYVRIANRTLLEVANDSFSKTRSSSLLCHQMDATTGTSFQYVWEQIKSSILKVSLIDADWTKDVRSMKNFTDWLDESLSYFTYSRLQHTSISRPIDQSRSIGRIHSIIEGKMKNPETAPPLRIFVFGGSVTNGHYCLANIFDFPVRNDGKSIGTSGTLPQESKICAWSGRLQDMMDEVFGVGVVDIKNFAVGGAKSDMSSTLMEYGLIPGSTPDIVIWDHGINDSMTYLIPNDKSSTLDTEQIFVTMQNFYQAAMGLPTSCDNPDPPLVILLDSLIGQQGRFPKISEALRSSAATSKMLAWYPDIWGISYANTVRPYILSNVNNQHNMIGLLGTNAVATHHGMMYHIAIAWIVMFNFCNALHDHCVTCDITKKLKRSSSEEFATTNNAIVPYDYLQLSHIPELHEDLRMLDIPKAWKDRVPKPLEHEECLEKQMKIKEESKKFTNHSSYTCFYAWMVNNVLNIEKPQQVDAVIRPYLVKNEGWSAYSTDRTVRVGGWIPLGGRGSFFGLQFHDVPTAVNSMTIIYMLSYSEMWMNSTLHMDCTFYNPSMNRTVDFTPAVDSSDTTTRAMNDKGLEYSTTIRHIISGYHEEETSILVPIKLPLPAREDGKSMLQLHFQLVDGLAFKIAGMILC